MSQNKFTCPECGADEEELDKSGHKPGCQNPKKAEKLLRRLFGNLIPITSESQS